MRRFRRGGEVHGHGTHIRIPVPIVERAGTRPSSAVPPRSPRQSMLKAGLPLPRTRQCLGSYTNMSTDCREPSVNETIFRTPWSRSSFRPSPTTRGSNRLQWIAMPMHSHWSNPLQTLAITIPFSLESSLRSAIQAFSSPRSSALNSRTSASTPETKKRPISNITPSTTSTRSSLSAMMHYNASASEMTASSAAAVPFFAFPITFSRRCSLLVCLPLAVDASSASKQSGPTLIALAATSSFPRDSACPTYTVMTRSASLTSIAAARAPPCGTNRCFSQNMAPMFRSTLPLFHPNFDFLLPSLATPPALKPPARLCGFLRLRLL